MVSKISKPLFWCALILLSELLAVFLLTGSWAFSHERKALICTTGLLFLLFSLFTPPKKSINNRHPASLCLLYYLYQTR